MLGKFHEIHMWSVYKLDGQRYSTGLNKKNKRTGFLSGTSALKPLLPMGEPAAGILVPG